jgi:hypothetical protein
MFCIHCGKTLPPGAFFCPNCGRKVETASEEGTPAEAHAPQTTKQPTGETAPPPPKIDCGFGLAILAVATGNVIGIVGLVYSVLARDMVRSGNYEGAQRAARTGKIWSWTAIILSAAMLCLGMLVLPRMVELIAPGLLEI